MDKPIATGRDIVLGSVDTRTPCAESEGFPWMTIDVTAIKDGEARH